MTRRWRVKHRPARTVYRVECHDIITLTMPYGYPPDRPGFEHAERRDEPECWQLWCEETRKDGSGWGSVLSSHATKEEARAALLDARRQRLIPRQLPLDAGTMLDAG